MNQPVYINWPHYTEAKVVQIFDASKKIWQSNGITKVTENPHEFHVCVDQLKARYAKKLHLICKFYLVHFNLIVKGILNVASMLVKLKWLPMWLY